MLFILCDKILLKISPLFLQLRQRSFLNRVLNR